MRSIKIAFVDFWKNCNFDNHAITRALKTKYIVEFVEPTAADYVFYSVFGDDHWFLPENTIKIFYTGENECPDFNICDYAIGFENLDFGDRYLRFPNYLATDFFIPKTLKMEKKHLLSDNVFYQDRDFCSFVVSNGAGNPIRKDVFETLSKYRIVDSGGRWLNNVGGPVEDKFEFEKRHKFSICFENSSHIGYTTEKIVEAFAAQTIPIYWGDTCVDKVFNPKAFINMHNFSSVEELVQEVKRIDTDDSLYMTMLKEPALIDDSWRYENQVQKLFAFLENIVEQDKLQAQRYNRDLRGQRYVQREQNNILNSRKSWKDHFKRAFFINR